MQGKKQGPFYGYVVAGAAFFVLTLISGTLYTYGVFLKPLEAEFGWSSASTAGAYSVGLFVMGILFMVFGRLNDRLGPRVVIMVSSVFIGVGYILMSRINSLWQLYLFRSVIVAIGTGGGFVPMSSTVARWFVKRRGIMTGIVTAGVGVGTVIMPPLASWLIERYDWRTSFLVIGVINLVLLMAIAQFLKRDPAQVGQSPYGLEEAESSLASNASGLSLVEAARSGQFWMACVIFLLFGSGLHSGLVHIVPHAINLKIPALTAATVLATSGMVSIIGRIGIGAFSDRVSRKASLILTLALMAGAFLWLQWATVLWGLYVFAVIFGFGTGGTVALESTIAAEMFGLKGHGAILGAIALGATTGGAIGSYVAGHLFDITGNYRLAFALFAAIVALGLALAIMLKPVYRKG